MKIFVEAMFLFLLYTMTSQKTQAESRTLEIK